MKAIEMKFVKTESDAGKQVTALQDWNSINNVAL